MYSMLGSNGVVKGATSSCKKLTFAFVRSCSEPCFPVTILLHTRGNTLVQTHGMCVGTWTIARLMFRSDWWNTLKALKNDSLNKLCRFTVWGSSFVTCRRQQVICFHQARCRLTPHHKSWHLSLSPLLWLGQTNTFSAQLSCAGVWLCLHKCRPTEFEATAERFEGNAVKEDHWWVTGTAFLSSPVWVWWGCCVSSNTYLPTVLVDLYTTVNPPRAPLRQEAQNDSLLVRLPTVNPPQHQTFMML